MTAIILVILVWGLISFIKELKRERRAVDSERRRQAFLDYMKEYPY